MADRFDKFTERARKVLTLAQEEAQRLGHPYIGTEHILLGLVRYGDSVAGRVLAKLGVDLEKARAAVVAILGQGQPAASGEIGLTHEAKRSLELATDEARRLNHHYVGTEHLLLGLVREGNGIAAGVLESLGVSVEMVRAEVIRVLKDPGSTPGDEARLPEQGQAMENPSPPGTLSLEMIQTLFDHSLWARDRLLAVIQDLDESALRQIPEGGAYGSIFDTLAHMAVSEWMWVQRCIGDSPMKLPRGEDFANLRVLTNWWNDAQATTQSFLISLRDADPGERVLEQEVTYTGPDGVARTRKVWHMLLQVTNHQTEHRSQIASMLGQMGHEVPPTDLVVYFSQKASK